MPKNAKNPDAVNVDDLVFEETPVVNVDDLVFEEEPSQSALTPENQTDDVLDDPNASFWDKTKRTAEIAADNVVNLAAGLVPLPLPDAQISDSPYTIRATANRAIDAVGEDDADFQTLKLVKQMADTRIGVGDDEQNMETFMDNAHNLLVEKLGYNSVGTKDGKLVAVDAEGKEVNLDATWWKDMLASVRGDKGEIYDAMLGGLAGAKAIKGGLKKKFLGGVAGGVGGAIFGNMTDQLMSNLATGEELSWGQRANEVGKAGATELAGAGLAATGYGVVQGVKGAVKATKTMTKFVDMAKKFDIQDYAQKKVVDDMAKLPEAEQERYLDALKFAKDNNIQLTSTSVLDHPQIDQLVQVLARNPFIRQGVKNLESKSRDKLIGKVFDVLETAGPKATAEELDPLLKQELGDALGRRNTEVRGLYDDFEKRVSGEVVTTAKALMDDMLEVGDKYGFREEGGKLLDEDILAAEAYVQKIFKPRIESKKLDAKMLDKISASLGKRASAYKVNNPKLHGYYSEAKGLVDAEIKKVSAYEGDDVAQALQKARSAYKEKVGIYGSKSEYSEIRKAMESDRPNEAIGALLKGDKGLDNANMLKQELGGTEAGDALIGALGRKQIDDVLAGVDMKSPSSLGKVLSSDKLKVAKRLLGEDASKKLDDIATLFEMMGRTEKLLAGAGSEIATANTAPLTTQMLNGVKKMMVRMQQKRLFGKVFDNTLAQDLLYKTLKGASEMKTHRDAKLVNSFLRRTARTIEKETGEDFSDIYDKRKIREVQIRERKVADEEKKALKQEVKQFKVPEVEELLAVGKTANNDDVVILNKSIANIQQGKHTDVDVERYIKARKSLDDETFAKAYEKEKVSRLPAKYRNENMEESLVKMTQLRDYLMSNPELKYGNEFSPQSVNALMRDLQEQGYPRSTKHDALYDEMKDMYEALKERIYDAYVLGEDGNSVFANPSHLGVGAGTGTINAFTNADANGDGVVTDEEFVQAFIVGMAGGTVGSKALALGLKKVNPKLFTQMSKAVDDGVDADGLVGVFAKSNDLESFGRNFAKYSSTPKKAIEKLIKEKNGQVRGALYHPEIGEIDLVWGKVQDKIKHTGYGLAHIIDKHGEDVARRLDDIVMGAKVLEKKGNRYVLANAEDEAIIALRWNSEDKNFVVTAYERMPEGQIPADAPTMIGESGNLSPKAKPSIAQKSNDVKREVK